MSDTPCPLCHPTGETVLWSDNFCRVIRVDDANYPGLCRVILNQHLREMTDLPPDQRQRLMDVVFAVEQAVREVVRPHKINLASLGNMAPHLHWHVIPRWEQDSRYPDAIWAPARREGRVPEGTDLQAKLAARLAELLK